MLELSIGILIWLFSLVGLILSIVVLIKQFKHGGALQGIIGIITCTFWTFVWGWIKHKSLAITKLMILWTVVTLAPFALVGVFGAAMMSQMLQVLSEVPGMEALPIPQGQKKMVNPKLQNKKALPKRTARNSAALKNADWNARALALWKNGRYSDPGKAKSFWDRAIAANPKQAEAYNNRGLAFYNLKRHQEAIKDFSQAIRMNPQSAAAYNNRGNAYYALGQYNKAKIDFDKSLQLKPKYAKAHLNRGLVYFQMQQMDQSCNDFRRACDLGDCDGLQWAIRDGFCK